MATNYSAGSHLWKKSLKTLWEHPGDTSTFKVIEIIDKFSRSFLNLHCYYYLFQGLPGEDGTLGRTGDTVS